MTVGMNCQASCCIIKIRSVGSDKGRSFHIEQNHPRYHPLQNIASATVVWNKKKSGIRPPHFSYSRPSLGYRLPRDRYQDHTKHVKEKGQFSKHKSCNMADNGKPIAGWPMRLLPGEEEFTDIGTIRDQQLALSCKNRSMMWFLMATAQQALGNVILADKFV